MDNLKQYRRTFAGCYTALAIQAFISICPPMLFVAFRTLYGLTYTELGALVFLEFAVQIVVDIIAATKVDKYGFRPFVYLSLLLITLGTIIFVLAPAILTHPYPLFVVGTFVYSSASGLLEVIVSPIVDNLPTVDKARAMSRLHGYYGLGSIFVVIATTLLIRALGETRWQIIMSLYLVLPLTAYLLFRKAPIIDCKDNERNLRFRDFINRPVFWLFASAIILAGVTELVMSQWASTFFETALGMDKLAGDLLAVASFAVFFTFGRLIYAYAGAKVNLSNACIIGAALCAASYTAIIISNIAELSIVCCALTGLGVALLWPGALSLATRYFPNASTKLFGVMGAMGDIGCAIGPFIVGLTADNIGAIPAMAALAEKFSMSPDTFGLKAGLLVGVCASLAAMGIHISIKRKMMIKARTQKM